MGSWWCRPQIRYFPATFSDYLKNFPKDERQHIQNYLDQQQNPLTRNLELRLFLYKIIFDFCQTNLQQRQNLLDDINKWKRNVKQDLMYWKNFSKQNNQIWLDFLQNNVDIFINIFSTEIQVQQNREISHIEIDQAIKIVKILKQNFLHYFDKANVENFFLSENIQIDQLIH